MTWTEQKKNLSDIFTNKKNGSIQEIKIKNLSRSLTNGEIQIAKSIYKNSIDYAIVKIILGSFFPLNSQNEDTFVTPNGSIYIMHKHYRDDYSLEDIAYKKLFIHELCHIWQHQRKLSVLANAGVLQACSVLTNFSYNPYIYNIWEKSNFLQHLNGETKKFLDYNLESQAEIFADYWILKNGYSKNYMLKENRKNVGSNLTKTLQAYEGKIKQVII